MIMEIRSANTLKLLDSKEIKSRREYKKTCKRLTKLVKRHNKINKENTEFLVRIKENSFIVKDNDYGYVVGLKESESRWL